MPDDREQLARLAGGELRELLRLLEGSDVEELELEVSGTKLYFKRDLAATAAPAATDGGADQATPPEPASTRLVAERVGFFHFPDGGAPRAGERVRADQVVGVVDSLNIASPVTTPSAGQIAEVLVEDGQPVEYGQLLFVIGPEE